MIRAGVERAAGGLRVDGGRSGGFLATAVRVLARAVGFGFRRGEARGAAVAGVGADCGVSTTGAGLEAGGGREAAAGGAGGGGGGGGGDGLAVLGCAGGGWAGRVGFAGAGAARSVSGVGGAGFAASSVGSVVAASVGSAGGGVVSVAAASGASFASACESAKPDAARDSASVTRINRAPPDQVGTGARAARRRTERHGCVVIGVDPPGGLSRASSFSQDRNRHTGRKYRPVRASRRATQQYGQPYCARLVSLVEGGCDDAHRHDSGARLARDHLEQERLIRCLPLTRRGKQRDETRPDGSPPRRP
jgi:hypothetical protein